MSWEKILKERMSDEHMERLRALPSYDLDSFEEGADVFNEVRKVIEGIEDTVHNKIRNLLRKAQASLMEELGVNQASGLGMSPLLGDSIRKAFETIGDMVHEDVKREYDSLQSRLVDKQ